MARPVVLALALALALPVAACGGKPPPDSVGTLQTLEQPPLPPLSGAGADRADLDAAAAAMAANFRRVHFGIDQSTLDAEARAALEANAALLAAHPSLRVEVQGHADARGTVDYNLALGQRRARAVVDHLQAHGAAPRQLTQVSLGEEQPLQAGAGEVAWSANRRAEFRVLTPGAPVGGTTTVSLLP